MTSKAVTLLVALLCLCGSGFHNFAAAQSSIGGPAKPRVIGGPVKQTAIGGPVKQNPPIVPASNPVKPIAPIKPIPPISSPTAAHANCVGTCGAKAVHR